MPNALVQDLRFTARRLAKSRLFTAVAVGSLAAGLGAHAAVFALIDALFLTPPPGVTRPTEIVHLRDRRMAGGTPRLYDVCHPDYVFYRDHSQAFSGLASHASKWFNDDERGQEVGGRLVSPNYFDVLGVAPHSGRFFREDENQRGPDAAPVVVSHAFWQGRLGGTDGAVGRTLMLSRRPFVVVGITPPGFRGAWVKDAVDLWIPALREIGNPSSRLDADDDHPMQILGRLADGRTIEEAETELSVLARRLELEHPETRPRVGVALSPLVGGLPWTARGGWTRSPEMETPWLLGATASCLLAIACANLAGLLLARGLDRQKELALRVALGASRARIVRQLLTESLLLSMIGATAGLGVARVLTVFLGSHYNVELEGARSSYDVHLSLSVFIYSVALAVVTGCAFGLVPAIRASRPAVVPALKEATSAGPSWSSWRAAFLVGQVALSAVLLIGAALMIHSLRTLLYDAGFDARGVAFLRMKPAGLKDAPYFDAVERRLKELEGVHSVAFVAAPPTWEWTTAVARPGSTVEVRALHNGVSPGFFDALRIPILRGRDFTLSDRARGTKVAVVNEAMARALWPSEDPVGQRLIVDREPYDVLGVVRYDAFRRAGREPEPYLFRLGTSNRLLVRVDGDAAAAIPPLLAAIRPIDPAVAVTEALPLSQVVRNHFAPVTLIAGLLNYAALLAVLLTGIGIYGVVAVAVGRRTRDIGIRMALGAPIDSILRMVLADSIRLIVLGAGGGIALAIVARRVLLHYLYGGAGGEILGVVSALVCLAVTTTLACLVPARRAARIDPAVALRHD